MVLGLPLRRCGCCSNSESRASCDDIGESDNKAEGVAATKLPEGDIVWHSGNTEMSKSAVVHSVEKTVTFVGNEEAALRDRVPGLAKVGATQGDNSKERKIVIRGSGLRPEIRYGRAVSQPEESDEMRLARFRIGGFYEDSHDLGSSIPSASTRRTQRNSRRYVAQFRNILTGLLT